MNLRSLLICALICGCGAFTSCSSSEDDAIIATQVADGTIPPWLAESNDGYTEVTDPTQISYAPPTRPTATTSRSTGTKAKTTSKTKTKAKATKTRYYTVKKGDVLERIARKHGVSTKNLMRANGLKSDLIRPGQKLRIP